MDNILVKPHITEKSSRLQNLNQYVFIVRQGANKSEIKKYISKAFKVHVENVNIINRKSKVKMWRNIAGKSSGYKKAIVTLKAGEKISLV